MSNEPVKEEKQTDDFNLVIETDKNIYKEDNEIQISSYFENVGEKDMKLHQKLSITIVIRNYDGGDIVEEIEFNDVNTTMQEGERFSKTVSNIKLGKGKYDTFVQTSPFTVGPSQFSLNTASITFEVK